MKYIYLAIILALFVFASDQDYQDQLALSDECFTDSCLCVTDCLNTEGD